MSSAKSADKWGEWESESHRCSCSLSEVYPYEAILYEVPFTNPVSSLVWDSFRSYMSSATHGLSDTFNGGLKPATHDYVEFRYNCTKCNAKAVSVVVEKTDDGKKVRKGRYTYKLHVKDRKKLLGHNNLQSFVLGTNDYNLISSNCSHYARAVFDNAE